MTRFTKRGIFSRIANFFQPAAYDDFAHACDSYTLATYAPGVLRSTP